MKINNRLNTTEISTLEVLLTREIKRQEDFRELILNDHTTTIDFITAYNNDIETNYTILEKLNKTIFADLTLFKNI